MIRRRSVISLVLCRQPCADCGAVSGAAGDLHPAAQRLDPVAQPVQAEEVDGLDGEAAPVVAHFDAEAVDR
jgi:hypothetical protein